MTTAYDCIVVGASFAGLACATALARLGMRTLVLEKKSDVGEKLHTTGIIVKDAVDQVSLLDRLPTELTRRIDGVRLYAPNMRHVDLTPPGYYFLATDTPEVLRWLAKESQRAGAQVACHTPFEGAARMQSGFDLGPIGTTRYLVGADGPRSRVATILGLGTSRHFLQGMEYEYTGSSLDTPDRLHCFLDRRLAPGYLAWAVAGVGMTQLGLARREGRHATSIAQSMAQFLENISPIVDLRQVKPSAVRAGLIPCGGVVKRVSGPRVMLVGDAAGMVYFHHKGAFDPSCSQGHPAGRW